MVGGTIFVIFLCVFVFVLVRYLSPFFLSHSRANIISSQLKTAIYHFVLIARLLVIFFHTKDGATLIRVRKYRHGCRTKFCNFENVDFVVIFMDKASITKSGMYSDLHQKSHDNYRII